MEVRTVMDLYSLVMVEPGVAAILTKGSAPGSRAYLSASSRRGSGTTTFPNWRRSMRPDR